MRRARFGSLLTGAMGKSSSHSRRPDDPAQDLIGEFAGIDDDPAYDMRLVLEAQHNSFDDWNEEQEYGEEACYTDKAIFAEQFHFRWLKFERSLRTEARL